jgi:phage FluMu protein Com
MDPTPFVRFRCRCCEKLLQVPEALGSRAVRCPSCFLVLQAPPRGLEELTPLDEIPVLEPLPERNFSAK